MIDNQSIWFSAVLDGVEHKAITKYVRVKLQNDICTSTHNNVTGFVKTRLNAASKVF